MNTATTTTGKTTSNNTTTLAKNLVHPHGTTPYTNNSVNKIQVLQKKVVNYFKKVIAPKIRNFYRKFALNLIIWCIIGIAAMLVEKVLPSFMDEYPILYKTATFGLKFTETFFTYIVACLSDIIESFKDFSFLNPFKAFAIFFKNLNIFGNLL